MGIKEFFLVKYGGILGYYRQSEVSQTGWLSYGFEHKHNHYGQQLDALSGAYGENLLHNVVA